jgi:hypothetical protein
MFEIVSHGGATEIERLTPNPKLRVQIDQTPVLLGINSIFNKKNLGHGSGKVAEQSTHNLKLRFQIELTR